MKELSVEEKAKRYDEAIQRARQFMETPYLENSDDVVGFIFPELKESEDEKIRKELITHCRNTRCVTEEGAERIAKWIAWLEKQGEQKPAEWREEDDEQLSFCCAAIELSNYSSDKNRNYAVSFLESIKDRVQPLPKQEWSEEDKRKIDRIYSILRQAADTHAFSTSCRLIGDKECIELQDFLKSIRPQSQWKPSDEQIEALDFAADCIVPDEFCFKRKVLKELLEQLKKLKG